MTGSTGSRLAATSFGWQVNQPRDTGPAGHIVTSDGSCLIRQRAIITIGKCLRIASS